MTAAKRKELNTKIALYGEQILSYLDQISKTPCPDCGYTTLVASWASQKFIVRCSPDLQTLNDEISAVGEQNLLPVCMYVATIHPVNLTEQPFTLAFAEKRPTKRNVPKARRRTY
jgi:hypothetical protein